MRTLKLKQNNIKWIFSYYIAIVACAVVVLLLLIKRIDINDYTLLQHCIFCILTGLSGSSMAYFRKLYKDCFLPGKIEICEKHSKETTATIFYYISRPIFSILFSIIVVLIFKAQLDILISGTFVVDNQNIIFVSAIVSFYVGFKTGKFINFVDKSEMIKNE